MTQPTLRPAVWWGLLAAIVGAGVLSRLVHTGWMVFDKYLGDALYAAMVYVIIRLSGRLRRVALWAAAAMAAIELFQLTRIPAALFQTGSPALRLLARLLGTEFSLLDLAAYAAGIGCLTLLDRGRNR